MAPITYFNRSPTQQLFTLSVGTTGPYHWALALSSFYFSTQQRIAFVATLTVTSATSLVLAVQVVAPGVQIIELTYFVVQVNKQSDWFWVSQGSTIDVIQPYSQKNSTQWIQVGSLLTARASQSQYQLQ
jgi:hypothetical protein